MPVDKTPLLAYLRRQEFHDRQMLILLRQSVARVDEDLKAFVKGVGAAQVENQVQAGVIEEGEEGD